MSNITTLPHPSQAVILAGGRKASGPRRQHPRAYRRQAPEGYGAAVSELGVRLSGGERRELGSARVLLYHKNPAVLVLDEATSALDGATEQAVFTAIQNVAQGTYDKLMECPTPCSKRWRKSICRVDELAA